MYSANYGIHPGTLPLSQISQNIVVAIIRTRRDNASLEPKPNPAGRTNRELTTDLRGHANYRDGT